MTQLKDFVIEAHGGLDRWRQFNQVSADLIQGGALWPLKGHPDTLNHLVLRRKGRERNKAVVAQRSTEGANLALNRGKASIPSTTRALGAFRCSNLVSQTVVCSYSLFDRSRVLLRILVQLIDRCVDLPKPGRLLLS